MTIAEALKDVDLEAGRTYRVRIDGRVVEVRVLEDLPSSADQPMLDPWIEFPHQGAAHRVRASSGQPRQPDPPVFSEDDAS